MLAPAAEVLSVMDRKNIRMMVNLTGGRGTGLDQMLREFRRAHPGRFLTFTEPWWSRAHEAGYPQFQADARSSGPRGPARADSRC